MACGERMHDTIARELKEEFGKTCFVEEYLGAIEHLFEDKGLVQHEINHCFRVTLPDVPGGTFLPSHENHLEFFWQPINKLDEINLRPAPIIWLIQSKGVAWGSTLLPGKGNMEEKESGVS